jgi:hypothetical protein
MINSFLLAQQSFRFEGPSLEASKGLFTDCFLVYILTLRFSTGISKRLPLDIYRGNPLANVLNCSRGLSLLSDK